MVVQTNGLVGVVLTSAEYPKRVAISMIREQLVLFEKEHGCVALMPAVPWPSWHPSLPQVQVEVQR